MERPILELEGLRVERGGRTVLTVPRLTVAAGERLVLLGPNGAGKSTLLLALAGLLPWAAGRLRWAGRPISPLDPSYRRNLALLLQTPLFLDLSVLENVALPLRLRGVDRPRRTALAWLERLGVAHLARRPAARLSGGEAQRVHLARALALRPRLLLLDEPFSGLDRPTRDRLLVDLAALLREEGVTSLWVTHDREEALALGDRVGILLGGRLRQLGPPGEVFRSPADPEVAAFVGVENVLPGEVEGVVDGVARVRAGPLRLEVLVEEELQGAVYVCIRPEEITLYPFPGPEQSSARNRLVGRVRRLIPLGPRVRVELDCGLPLVVWLSAPSARELGLREGARAVVTFKASAACLVPMLYTEAEEV